MTVYRNVLRGFHQRLAGEALCNLAGVAGHWIPSDLRTRLRRSGQRKRVFTPMATFWNFLAQVLSPAQPCRETVRQIQGARGRRNKTRISSSASAYCRARQKLPESILLEIWQHIARQLSSATTPAMHWMGLRVAVVDGTTISMPDTPQNQTAWTQPSEQKTGCGFPVMKIVGLFSLTTGAVCTLVSGTLHNAEHALFVQMWNVLTSDFDLLLGDRNFGSYATFTALRLCGLHGVFRLHQRRKIEWRKGRRLGKYDRLVTWTKPKKLSWWLPLPCPDTITVRITRVCVPIPGFRTRVIFLSSTLLDPKLFTVHALAELYRRRWDVELFFRHIKTTMHMNILRCLSPEMIRRELHMHMIAYNLIRTIMFQAVLIHDTDIDRISFKGTCDTLRQWAPHLASVAHRALVYRRLFRCLLQTLIDDLVPYRPNRSEPRAVKRRPKNYHLLNKPRRRMGNLPHRNSPK